METKFTPGPWEIYEDNNSDYPGIKSKNGVTIIYECYDQFNGETGGVRGDNILECINNANLIAAAPDLLESLVSCVTIIENYEIPYEYEYYIQKAKEAIRKTGSILK